MLVIICFFILTFSEGVFSGRDPPPCGTTDGCKGDLNATHVECGSACPATCAEPDSGRACIDVCVLNGCKCNTGYILSEPGGVCIAPGDCPGGSPICGANQTYVGCKFGCPTNYCPADDSRAIVACSLSYPCFGGCACQSGYLLVSRDDERCILASECPPVECTRQNEVWEPSPSNCYLESCEDRGSICDYPYPATPRCVCQKGYYRNGSDICIPESECPDLGCNGDPNAMPKDCPSSCPPTCANRNTNTAEACIEACLPGGCVCKPGFILTEIGGKCVRPEECPGELGCKGDRNATFKECLSDCPLTCANQDQNRPCLAICRPSGCECNPGYVLTEKGGKCIKPEDCPAERQCNGDRNATFMQSPNACRATCDKPDTDEPCNDKSIPSGCVCKQGYLLTKIGGKCIQPKDCPGGSPTCSANSTYVYCKVGCPTNYCPVDDSLAEIACDPTYPCPGGCACKGGYLILSYEDDRCILASECPPVKCTRPNEVWDPKLSNCLRERCDDRNIPCDFPFPIPPRCVCEKGYFRNNDDICVPESECPAPECGLNEVATDCAIRCPPQSCESIYTTYMCAELNYCSAGCNCVDGYLRNSSGICIPSEECFKDGCKGDLNATHVECGSACPATCAEPDSERACIDVCVLNGCKCNTGYILSEPGGVCIAPGDCPGGSPICGANQTYVGCKFGCPTNYCPADDSRAIVACSLSYPCFGGCACQSGYLLVSRDDERCILASECPPVECTRPNEVWEPSPSSCYLERCEDRGSICDYPYPATPRCVCQKGYYRNESDICIPESECPDLGCNGDPNGMPKDCPSSCPPTCANRNTNRVVACIEACLPGGCVCKPGFILTEIGGKCVRPEECPAAPECGLNEVATDCAIQCPPQSCESIYTTYLCAELSCTAGCNCIDGYLRNSSGICIPSEECFKDCKGDLNATHVECGDARPATCAEPDSENASIEICVLNGCKCNPGYILSEPGGVCIAPGDCPGGSPICGANQTYVGCKFGCPTDYCPADDSGLIILCSPPFLCIGGCACQSGYLLVSSDDERCILSSECPPVECTRPNEVWEPSPSNCYLERCEDRGSICDYPYPATPRCVCQKGYYRNQSDICIPESECPDLGCNGDPNAMPKDCPSSCPPTCANRNTNRDVACIQACLPGGCVCKPGFILTEIGGKCVRPEECPGELGCKGDRNATFKECLSDCPLTCANQDQNRPCLAICRPSGCECNPGYVLTEKGGKCIKPEDCPAEPQCKGDRNATFVQSPSACRATCDKPDTDEPCNDKSILSGCVCKQGYLLTKIGGICIEPKDCPGGSPTCSANSTYVYCKVGCPTNYCPVDDSLAEIACDPTYPCPGGCACKGGYLILSYEDDRCILASECPPVKCTRPNEVWDPKLSNCLRERCDDRNIPCDFPFPIPPRCVCEKGYFRNNDDICVPESECPAPECGLNEVATDCAIQCPPQSCESIYTTYMCAELNYCSAGCNCVDGYLRNSSGICIPSEECFKDGCKGDLNATHVECGSACPATCAEPDSERACIDVCVLNGCKCNTGYILSEPGGVCIAPGDCPGGSPICGANQTYVGCKFGCPTNYCPADDSRGIVACSLSYPCFGGCACQSGYLLVSRDDERCILASECPPVECTRPNEVWEPSPSNCYLERCEDRGSICDYPYPATPRCVCQKGYYRNESDICIPESECRCNGDPNAMPKDCPSSCPTTCANRNTNRAVACIEACLPGGCVCKPGFILTEIGGKCVRPEECPAAPECGLNEVATDCAIQCPPQSCESIYTTYLCAELSCTAGCNCIDGYLRNSSGICIPSEECFKDCKGDLNATHVECGDARPATCAEPDSEKASIEICVLNGCKCNPGYILSEPGGVCIAPGDCPGGLPKCGANLTYVGCKLGCPSDYCPVDDSGLIILCSPPFPCIGGCACQSGYLLVSRDDERCILASECPPVECTRPNEVWEPSPSSCYLERCENRGSICDFPYPAPPRCVCQKGYYRNQSDICIPESECPDLGCNGDPNAMPKDCPSSCPPTCANRNTNTAVACIEACLPGGCVCKPGFILTEIGGKCVRPEECPAAPECGLNEVATDCAIQCPPQTCESIYTTYLCVELSCSAGCNCIDGYLRNSSGICIPSEECFKDCKGDLNAMHVECGDARPATCAEPDSEKASIEICVLNGCKCNPGYILSEPGGVCIAPGDCPGGLPKCGANLTYVGCKLGCPSDYCPVDDSGLIILCSPPFLCIGGCACQSGYLLVSSDDERCILSSECPPVECTRPNEVWEPSPSNCYLERCEDRGSICDYPYPATPRCVCQKGYYRNQSDICIPESECPDLGCNGDPNAMPKDCPSSCPPTCANRNTNRDVACIQACLPGGCVCKPGFILTEIGGKCVRPEECPGELGCKGDRNATFKECLSDCPLTCANQDQNRPCLAICRPSGCECNPGYVLTEKGGKCIKPEDCPAEPQCKGDRNATFVQSPSACRATCDKPDTDEPCNDKSMLSGCVCKQGYLLTKIGGICIEPKDCPGGSPTCSANSTYVYCKVGCPTNYCPVHDSLAEIACDPTYPCPGGCACKGGYLILSYEDDRCILASECPPVKCTRPNEVWDPKLSNCLRERCNDRNIPCDFPFPIPPRCVCEKGYFRNNDDICVPESECPAPECGLNEVATDCAIQCPPQTCESIYTTYLCVELSCSAGCNCIDGYLRNSSGICIPSEECFKDCKGDLNATHVECGDARPATCAEPDSEKASIEICVLNECKCNPGYILSEPGGVCIAPGDCPGGSPICGANKTYVGCKFGCPTNYCPADDSRAIVACSPPYPCLGGCACQSGFLLVSRDDERCILASECPPVECTRPNEVWEPNPSNCYLERCEDRGSICDFPYPATPRCVCQKGYYRNGSDICIPESECPDLGCNGDPNAMPKDCPSSCPPTCANRNTNRDVACIQACLPGGCVCKPGFILTEIGGKCVRPEECPGELGCKGDRNATFKECLSDCPLTCANQDQNRPCLAICRPSGCECNPGYVLTEKGGKCIKPEDCPAEPQCKGDRNATFMQTPSACRATCDKPDTDEPCNDKSIPSGCVCKQGYLLTKIGGKCIQPKDCPGGSPTCSANRTYVYCKVGCPTNYCPVDDSLAEIACDPIYPCPGGCACKGGYLMLSYEDDRCILASECPPVKCTRPNEVWDPQPSNCLRERCDNRNIPCDFPFPIPPRCVCEKGYFRNEDDICVPESECHPSCPEHEHYTENDPTCLRTCANRHVPKSNDCKPFTGCVCDGNLVRLYDNATGPCIPEEKCPNKCNDPKAVYVKCPNPCPLTCAKPDPRPCSKMCVKYGCECASGYILSEIGGKCIKPKDCPARCPKHEHYVKNDEACLKTCGNRLLPGQDTAGACKPFTGCVCDDGYVRKYDNATGSCIPVKSCPPIPKCGVNEVPTSCRIICPPQTCDSLFTKYHCVPSDCEPGCDCRNNYLRNSEGLCILSKDCFKKPAPECGLNEVATDCAIQCPPQTCESIYTTYLCAERNCTAGCNCIDGYLRNSSGICIPSEECFKAPVKCPRPNEVWDPKPSNCLRERCDNRNIPCDFPFPIPPRCVCKKGYFRNDDDICVPESECPRTGCLGYPNTQPTPCISPCPATCCEPDSDRPCDPCSQPGCECKPGYILSKTNGKCIRPTDCPGGSPTCCTNMTYTSCKVDCSMKYCPTGQHEMFKICDPVLPCYTGCVCKEGYMWISKADKTCILAKDCPPVECTGPNEVWDPSPPFCYLEKCKDIGQTCNDNRVGRPRCVCKTGFYRDTADECIPAADCPPPAPKPECTEPNEEWDPSSSKCVCKEGYVRDQNGACIPKDDPKKCNDPKAVYVKCPNPCPLTCAKPDPRPCSKMCVKYGCECASGYILSEIGGKCIKPKDCPATQKCGYNEVAVPCRTICPPQNCEIAYTDYYCTEESKKCEPGCDCVPNHLRNGSGICIPNEECPYPTSPICGINEIARDCKRICPPQTCDSKYILYRCRDDIPCEAGCDCVANYLRDANGICIPSEECPPLCSVPDKCKRTCAKPNPRGCSYSPSKTNIDGCNCKEGYILSKLGGKCIKIEDCPRGCNGDRHARTKRCPLPCPSTCKAPNAVNCKRKCEPIACECESGYILSNSTGKCILPEKCPGGNPCGKNAHFVDCKVNCPRNYCPEDDRRDKVICDPPRPCLPGCVCNLNHKRKSKKDPRCIVSSDCPPVKCRRPNEEWSSCPSACLAEDCKDVNNQPTVCNTLVLNCEPACICKKNYFRNATGICIRARDCPCSIPDKCKRTCARPNPTGCPYRPPKDNVDGCDCKEGYILSKLGGKCIRIEDCPRKLGCNGDPHAITKTCPQPCPSTCDAPNAFPCKRKCDPIGCECEPGYLLSNVTGRCILPKKCPGGNPCGKNEHFVACKVKCPRDYCPVDDSRAVVVCDGHRPCLSGCICDINHKRKSREDPRCIKASDCPPVKCTRPNEEWCSCPSACLAEDCKDVNKQPTVCNTLVLNCEPACICKKDYFRNATGLCIRARDCPCPIPDKCKRTCARPNPRGCPYRPPNDNVNGCDCKEGYILSKLGGKCIRIEDCPRKLGCNGDPHAITKTCPQPCPSTCDAPNAFPCKRKCDPIGCECEPGYLLSNVTGRCILPKKCPGGNPCGKNEHFVACKVKCPRDYCPVDDSRAVGVCDGHRPCLSGCICDINHKRKSREDPRCIKASDCLPVKCTRPNEEWSSCPSACLAEDCKDVNKQPTVCNPLVLNCEPACICKKDYFRNATGICIRARDCPCPIPDKCKRTCARPNPRGCPYRPPNDNVDGCDCKQGYILSKLGGKCIKIEDCPRNLGCNGDPNAITKRCPVPCPSTCKVPDASPCKKACEPIGCQCKPGYILSNVTGKCILPDECPGGNPCGKNAHFVDCKRNGPRDYCPENDIRDVVIGNHPPPCLPGCVCNLNHKRKSRKDPRCIVSSDCPPVKCTRPNEEWCSCPSACLAEDCKDVNNQPTVCNPLVLNCEPACICKKDYFRNATGICIPAKDCPCPIPDKCKRTCARPNPTGCPYKPPKDNVDGCHCKEGYILSKLGGKCIKIEDCPYNLGCNGDPNAITKRCPLPCPSTCKVPDASPCKKACEPIGCQCKPGYILSNVTGKCILPDKCPGGNPCGKNAHFVDCKRNGPRDYCPENDIRDVVTGNHPPPCLPGCVCNLNHKRKSRKDPRCIVSSDCSPVKCTRPNEEWSSCPSACLAEDCKDVNNQPTVCNPLVLNCQPACICKKNYFRNATGICIPAKDCPCPVPDKCKRTCARPNPTGCPYKPPKYNVDGCHCKEGYILSKLGGKCIKIEDCPRNLGCNGDPNAITKRCPLPCPSTCKVPDASPCKKACEPIGCQCKPGYILSNVTGKCILPDKCPGGNPCGKNAHFVDCKTIGPRAYCPKDDSRPVHKCASTPMCLPGCICNLNHKRKSQKDPRCIVSSDCPPVICTRPNEEWCSCPSPCLAEDCKDVNNQPTVCNPLVLNCEPACICNKDYFRNATGICIPAKDCPC